MLAPDILGGFMVHGTDQDNTWQTHVEAALFRTDPDGTRRRALLASDCRAEHVGPPRIFGKRLSEVAVLDCWTGRYMLRAGAGLYPTGRWRTDDTDPLHCGAGPAGWVHCPEVATEQLPFDAVLAELAAPPQGRDNHLYMRLAWRQGDHGYELFAPCRYLNYRNPDRPGGRRYLQPITGYVPLEAGDRFFVGYAAAYVEEGKVVRAELAFRRRMSYFATKAGIAGRLSMAAMAVLDRLIGGFFSLDEFGAFTAIEASCDFYRYAGNER